MTPGGNAIMATPKRDESILISLPILLTIMLPVFLGIYEKLFPNFHSLTDSPELDAICYILVVSAGSSILFNRNASSGGEAFDSCDYIRAFIVVDP